MAKIEIKLDTKTNRYKQVLDREDDPKEKASNIIRHLVSILNRELDRYLKEND